MLDMSKCIIAYIDAANLHKGIQTLGWKLDYRRFRVWLQEKFHVSQAYLFIGMISHHADLYTELVRAGYILVFKEVIFDAHGRPKGNCDADLVLRAARDVFEEHPEKVVLVSSDGDYAPLVKLWQEKNVPHVILSPSLMRRCSILLKRSGAAIVCLNDIRSKIEKTEK